MIFKVNILTRESSASADLASKKSSVTKNATSSLEEEQTKLFYANFLVQDTIAANFT